MSEDDEKPAKGITIGTKFVFKEKFSVPAEEEEDED